MKVVEYDDIDIRIYYTCPECKKEQFEVLSREPDEFDTDCDGCGELFTVKCFGNV